MVRPNDQAEHTDTRHGVDHPDRAKHGLTRKGGDHVADQTKPRQDEDVNLGVAKKPEQVQTDAQTYADAAESSRNPCKDRELQPWLMPARIRERPASRR